jgi:NAD(P)-dependent dehydrogenase (short-subunit alcohol dehydrogenase family)
MTVVFLRRPSGQSQFSVQRNACGTSLLRVDQSVICYPGCPIVAQTARGRVGLPDDIGSAVASLLTHHNLWITGQRIEASGGMLL